MFGEWEQEQEQERKREREGGREVKTKSVRERDKEWERKNLLVNLITLANEVCGDINREIDKKDLRFQNTNYDLTNFQLSWLMLP